MGDTVACWALLVICELLGEAGTFPDAMTQKLAAVAPAI